MLRIENLTKSFGCREVLKDLMELLETEAEKKEKHAYLSLNWPQAVLHVSFAEQLLGEQMVMEEANEGEQL